MYNFVFCYSVGEQKNTKKILNQNKHSKEKGTKRQHSPTEDDVRKKPTSDDNPVTDKWE